MARFRMSTWKRLGESEERVLKSVIFITKYHHYPSFTLTFNWYMGGVFICMTLLKLINFTANMSSTEYSECQFLNI